MNKRSSFRTWIIFFVFVLSIASLSSCVEARKIRKASRKEGAGAYKTYLNIPYSTASQYNKLDIYEPAAGNKLPVLINVHGGAWRAGDKKRVNYRINFLEQGFLLVSINYRLSPDAKHPAHIQDVAKAIKWIYDNISDYGGDRQKLFLMGHSAGSHLVSLVATDKRYLQEYGLGPQIFSGVIALDCGYYDIPLRMEVDANDQQTNTIVKDAFGDSASVWYDASPVNYVSPGKGIAPFIFIYAQHRESSKMQAENFSKELKDSGISAEVYSESTTHAEMNKKIGLPIYRPTQRVSEFLEKHL